MKKVSWKLMLIIITIIAAVAVMCLFMFQGVKNKAISYEEQITNAQSEIKVQEKRRADLIPNLVDCVKQYDKHEYETLMSVVKARGANSDAAIDEIQTLIAGVAEAYPQLQSSSNYKEIMNELAASENLIAGVRGNYNDWITKYNRYVRHFPNKQILRALGYEKINCHKLDFDVSKDAPTDLFGE